MESAHSETMSRASRLCGGALVAAALVLVCLNSPVGAQLGIDTPNAAGDVCECSPACEGDVGTSLGGVGCRGRVVARADCPCCKVCAQQEGSECSHPALPCDTEFGLVCSPEGICKAEYSCQADGECPEDRFCLGGVCVDPCPILTPCQGVLKGGVCVSKAHRPVCQCPNGTIANSAGDVCVPMNGTAEEMTMGKEEETTLQEDEAFADAVMTTPIPDVQPVEMSEGEKVAEDEKMSEGEVTAESKVEKKPEGEKKAVEAKISEGEKMAEGEKVTESDKMPEGEKKAVVVEYNKDGEEIHRITVNEQIEVVTTPGEEAVEITTSAGGAEEVTEQPVSEGDEGMVTEAAPEEPLEAIVAPSAREGKMAPEEESVAGEEEVSLQEKDSLSKSSSGGLKVLAVTHNTSTIVLPSTKGGDIYYRPSGGQEWLRETVEAGQDSVVLRGLVPKTQYTLKWSGASGGSAKITIDTEDGCQVKNVSYGVAQEWSEGCQHRCSCRPDGTPDCQPRCLFVAGDIEDPTCNERPAPEDPECCVVYDCKKADTPAVPPILKEEQKPGQPKLLVTKETYNSVTLAWDDFRAKRHEGGYVIEYREADEASLTEDSVGLEEKPWMRKELPVSLIPSFTVQDLKPNTIYQVRVSIYGDSDDARLGDSTETLTVRTDPGCIYRNESHAVGEFFVGCEERCMCLVNGDTKCFERCSLPYFRAGAFKDDPKCREQPTNRDECCVTVQCFTTQNTTFSTCSNVVCGANAKCVASDGFSLSEFDSEVTLGYCRCLEGFVGDASDLQTGCVPDPSIDRKEGVCTYKNNTYSPGDVFFDDCEYRCSCTKSTEIECEPRCEFPYEAGSKTEPGCEYIPDPEDFCCKLHVCNSTSEAATNAARAPSLISDGCTENNVTYAKNEKFYKGCETQCICMGFGDVSCFPRCPPSKVVSKTPKRCETLPDPLDSCCSITVCDEETPDVMKANITEMEKEMMMMKERMKNMTEMEKDMLMKRMSELEKEMMMKNISDMETILQHMIEKKNELINSNISDSEKEMIRNNMTEIEMMMKDVAQMEKEIMRSDLTDTEKTILKRKLMEMQKTTEEMIASGEIDEHTRMHLLGIEHSHFHDSENHTHTHDDGTTHNHPGGHLPHSHDEMENHTHTHDDGTTHSHPEGHLPHSHDDMENHTHTHEDGTTHSHPGGQLPHSHDDMENHTHTHEDGTTHSHPGGHLPHSHDDMDNHTHTHEDGTTHSHPGGLLLHSHNDMDNHTHTHEDGTTHSHPVGHLPHSHDNMDNHTHTHEDGTTHSHPGGHLPHTHDDMDNFTHTHEDGTTHSHPGGHLPHTHDDMDNFTHTHENGTTHSHPDGHLPHTHDDMNTTHTHEDGTTHHHPDGHLPHSHDDLNNHTHTHEDGTTHSHPDENNSDSHGMDIAHSHTLATDENHNHTHTHEDGTVHTHPHDHNDPSLNHTHLDEEHDHIHTHEDGTTHSHPHDHTDISHDHTHSMDDENSNVHTHEDGTTHSHPLDHMDESGDNMHKMDEEHGHVHTHENGTTHSHPHDHLDEAHNHVHGMDDDHNHTHTHEDGTTHSHPHDTHNPVHGMDDGHNHTHTHEDGTTHSHPHDHLDDTHNHTHDDEMHPREETSEFHDHTVFGGLEKKNRAEDLGTHDLNILSVVPVNATTVEMRVGVSDSVMSQLLSNKDESVKVLYSPDSLTWMEKNISVGDINLEHQEEMILYISDLQPSTPYQFRISYRDHVSSTSKARLLDGITDLDALEAGIDIDPSVMCSSNGRYYKPGEEFYEGCSRSCICSSNLEIHCADIECPVTFGLELVDPNCLEWDVDKDYVPTPPKCCAQVTCISSAACDYMGQRFNNYDTIPRELTGCSKVCTCNYGNVTCRDLCDPVPLVPPPELNCAPEDAIRVTLPGETCCETWQCPAHSAGGTPVVFPLPPESVLNGTPTTGFIPIDPSHTSLQFGEDELIPRPHVQSLDAYTAQLMFSTPSHYQGLPGELIIRYTNDSVTQTDPEMWTREVIVPSGTTISNTKWEYKLHNLEPNTQYAMQLVLSVINGDPITSPLFTYTTMPEASTPPTTTPLARLDIDAELHASEVTKTSAKVSWRIFNDYELQYIDGVQIKYTAKDKLIPKFSQLFHRDNDQMDLRGLQPGNTYTVDLVFITHKNQTTQVSNTHPITFTTLPEEDPYAFDIIVTAGKVSSQTAELFYSGVPEPEEKYVNVYRAVYLREDERIDAQTFKIPKTGQEKKIFLSDLKPDVEYQVWLEAFLSNGRKKKSNVITVTTRADQLPKPERSEVDPSVSDDKEADGYYPALVAVAIIAAIACLGFLGLLIILLRKQSHAKAHINSSKNNAAYDNPSYRGYEMEMNGIRGSSNGATHVEEP